MGAPAHHDDVVGGRDPPLRPRDDRRTGRRTLLGLLIDITLAICAVTQG